MNKVFGPVLKIALVLVVLAAASLGLLLLADQITVEAAKSLGLKIAAALAILALAGLVIGLLSNNSSSAK